jgi:hypothetical protein
VMAVLSTCRTCQREFEQSGKGRPRKDCTQCRPPGSKPAVATFEPVSKVSASMRQHPRMAFHGFVVDSHPAAWRWCAMCGLPKEKHPL